jgi:hypothetical protein
MEAIVGIVILVVIVLVIRLFGAWMLRIDEVISLQKQQIELTRQLLEKK